MPFYQPDTVRYYTFASFEEAGVSHAVFTRQGGVSPSPWQSLNVGGTVGDDPGCVVENRLRSFRALNRSIDTLFDVWQVHSADVICTTAPRQPEIAHLKADAILTDRSGVTLFMRFADCVPILLYDPVRKVCGLVHAGWQGTVRQVVAAAVRRMTEQYHTLPVNILAAIGPSIGPHHYPVGKDVIDPVKAVFGEDASGLLQNAGSAIQLNLWAANQLILENAGVEHIEIAGICTACDVENWYSHRAEHGQTGRFGVLIGLKE